MKKKLLRYSYNEKSEFIIQEGKSIYNDVKKNWSKFFKNKNPLFIELGCGYGEHTTKFSFLLSFDESINESTNFKIYSIE